MDVLLTVPSDTWYSTERDFVTVEFDVDEFVIDPCSDTNFSAYIDQRLVIRPTLVRAYVEIKTFSDDEVNAYALSFEGDALSVLNDAAAELIARSDECFDDVDTIVSKFVRNMRWEVK